MEKYSIPAQHTQNANMHCGINLSKNLALTATGQYSVLKPPKEAVQK
jgi:hypothetical protein